MDPLDVIPGHLAHGHGHGAVAGLGAQMNATQIGGHELDAAARIVGCFTDGRLDHSGRRLHVHHGRAIDAVRVDKTVSQYLGSLAHFLTDDQGSHPGAARIQCDHQLIHCFHSQRSGPSHGDNANQHGQCPGW